MPHPPLPRSPLLEAWSILATPAATPAEAAAKATIEEVASAYLRHRGATQRFSPTCGIGGVRPAPMPPSDGPPSQETPLTQLATYVAAFCSVTADSYGLLPAGFIQSGQA